MIMIAVKLVYQEPTHVGYIKIHTIVFSGFNYWIFTYPSRVTSSHGKQHYIIFLHYVSGKNFNFYQKLVSSQFEFVLICKT